MALGKSPTRYRLQAFALGGALMGLAGAMEAHFIGFIAPESYLSSLTFQVWAMLIVGGSGNNLGALLGAAIVWALWTVSGLVISDVVPADLEARAAALRLVAIGVAAGDDDRLAPARPDRRTRARVAPCRRRRKEIVTRR